jgi:hypothetical protein
MSWDPNEKPLSKREMQELFDAERARKNYESSLNQAGTAAGELMGMGLFAIHSNPRLTKYNYLLGVVFTLVSFILLVDNDLGWFWKIVLPLLAGLLGWTFGLLALLTFGAVLIILGLIEVLKDLGAF